MTNQKDQPAESLGTCPNCGSTKRDERLTRHYVMMCPPANWRWVMDARACATDEIVCCHWWHDAQPTTRTDSVGAGDVFKCAKCKLLTAPGEACPHCGGVIYNISPEQVGAQPETEEHTCQFPNNLDGPCFVCEQERLAPLPVDEWILERYENCIRIAKTKTDESDMMSWMEDAEYFRRVLIELKCLSEERAANWNDARAWCDSMRQDPEIGLDIQDLQSWRPQALARVIAKFLDLDCERARSVSSPNAQEVAAIAYQIIGALLEFLPVAPVRILDYFSAIAQGKTAADPLPFSPDECVAVSSPQTPPRRQDEHNDAQECPGSQSNQSVSSDVKAPEVAPIQSAPDWLDTELWNFAHAAAIELGVDNGVGPTSSAEDAIYRNMRMVCRMYASSSNAAQARLTKLAQATMLQWREVAEKAEAKVIEQESLLKTADDEVSHLTGEVRELRAERDRLQEALREAQRNCKHPVLYAGPDSGGRTICSSCKSPDVAQLSGTQWAALVDPAKGQNE